MSRGVIQKKGELLERVAKIALGPTYSRAGRMTESCLYLSQLDKYRSEKQKPKKPKHVKDDDTEIDLRFFAEATQNLDDRKLAVFERDRNRALVSSPRIEKISPEEQHAKTEKEEVDNFYKSSSMLSVFEKYNLKTEEQIKKELDDMIRKREEQFSKLTNIEPEKNEKNGEKQKKKQLSHFFKTTERKFVPIGGNTPGVGWYRPKYEYLQESVKTLQIYKPPTKKPRKALSEQELESDRSTKRLKRAIAKTPKRLDIDPYKPLKSLSSSAQSTAKGRPSRPVSADKLERKQTPQDEISKWLEKRLKPPAIGSSMFMSKTKIRQPIRSESPDVSYWPGADVLKFHRRSPFLCFMGKTVSRDVNSLYRKPSPDPGYEPNYDMIRPRNAIGDQQWSKYATRQKQARTTRFGITRTETVPKYPDRFYETFNPNLPRDPTPIPFDKLVGREKKIIQKEETFIPLAPPSKEKKEDFRKSDLPLNVTANADRIPFFTYFDKTSKRQNIQRKSPTADLQYDPNPEVLITRFPVPAPFKTYISREKREKIEKLSKPNIDFYNVKDDIIKRRAPSVDIGKLPSRETHKSSVIVRSQSVMSNYNDVMYDAAAVKDKLGARVKGDPFIRSHMGRDDVAKLHRKKVVKVDRFYDTQSAYEKVKSRIPPGYIQMDKQTTRDGTTPGI